MARFVIDGLTPTEIASTPVGAIVPFGGTVAAVPVGYLPCDGSVVSQTTFPALFTAIGSAWDTGGEGGGNFRLPDLRGKGCIGLNDGTLPNGNNGSFSTRLLAATSGSETTNHNHGAGSYSATSAGDHTHTVTVSPDPGTFLETNLSASYPGNDGLNGRHTHNASSGSGGTHSHSVVGTSGSDNSTNMSPFAVTPYIVKT